MGEGHKVQFPSDIQVFYVSPPALDDLKRWMRDYEAKMKAESAAAADQETSDKPGSD
jgi:hypothetical protein